MRRSAERSIAVGVRGEWLSMAMLTSVLNSRVVAMLLALAVVHPASAQPASRLPGAWTAIASSTPHTATLHTSTMHTSTLQTAIMRSAAMRTTAPNTAAAQPASAPPASAPPAPTPPAPAQPARAGRSPTSASRAKAAATARTARAMRTIDAWLVARYRGVQLLPDSVIDGAHVGATAAVAAVADERAATITDAAYARVESVIATAPADTLLALQFGAQTGRAPLASGATVRLSGPTGAISTATGRILARRAFRTTSTPGAARADDAAWRYGWAYVAVVPRDGKVVAGSGLRSWLLLEENAPVTRR